MGVSLNPDGRGSWVVGLDAILGVTIAAAFLSTLAPLATAVLGGGMLALLWPRYRGPGIFRAVRAIWGSCLLILGIY